MVQFDGKRGTLPRFDISGTLRKLGGAVRNPKTGAAWLSSARALRCLVQSINERNPRPVLYISQETAGAKSEEGEDDVKSAWPLYLGLHTCYNGRYSGKPTRKGEPIPKADPSSD